MTLHETWGDSSKDRDITSEIQKEKREMNIKEVVRKHLSTEVGIILDEDACGFDFIVKVDGILALITVAAVEDQAEVDESEKTNILSRDELERQMINLFSTKKDLPPGLVRYDHITVILKKEGGYTIRHIRSLWS
jgi:hypothetical protein